MVRQLLVLGANIANRIRIYELILNVYLIDWPVKIEVIDSKFIFWLMYTLEESENL